MKKNTFLLLLVLSGLVLLAGQASAVTAQPRPLPTLPPTTPISHPVISAS